MNILELLEHEEGYRSKPYYCSEKFPTVGIGQKIGPKNANLDLYQFTVSRDVAYVWLGETVEKLQGQLSSSSATMLAWKNLNQARRDILTSMAYQMGFDGVCKFKKMIAAAERSDFSEMSRQALDSRWAKQTPRRANRHAEVIKTGTWEAYR